eukprot:Rhum_TRINITY_DN3417_c0_g1::Rhum_TRINITY_DN3417_c0_g1_i1::g.10634::m.10634
MVSRTVHHRLHRIVVHPQAVLNPLVVLRRRLRGAVDVGDGLRRDEPPVVVHHCLDHVVRNRLRHDVLRVVLGLRVVEVQLLADVREADAAVREGDAAQTRLDHVVAHALDEHVRPVFVEQIHVFLHNFLEAVELTETHSGGEGEVGRQSVLQTLSQELGPGRDLTHQKLDDEAELGGDCAEADSLLRGLPQGLVQEVVRLCVVQLHCLHVALEEAEAGGLVRRAVRLVQLRVGDDAVGLLDEVVVQKVLQDFVQEDLLPQLVVLKGACPQQSEQCRPRVRRQTVLRQSITHFTDECLLAFFSLLLQVLRKDRKARGRLCLCLAYPKSSLPSVCSMKYRYCSF